MTYQRNISVFLEKGFDEGLPDGVEQTQIATGEHRESERDGRALEDLAAVGPLDAPQLVDAVAEEGQQPPTALAGPRVGGPLRGARPGGREEIVLDLVGRALGVRLALALVEAGRSGLGHVGLFDVRHRVLGRLGRRGVAQARVVRVGLVEPDVARVRARRARRGASGPRLALGAALLRALTITSHGERSLPGLAV